MEAPKPFIVELENELKLLQQELSQRRKKAEDVKIAELLYLKIKAKITMAAATGLEKDIDNAHKAIEAVWTELGMSETLRVSEHAQKSEIFDKNYKRKSKEEKADELVEGMKKAFSSGNKEEGKRLYMEIRQLYPQLSEEKKKEVAREIAAIVK